MKNKTLQKGIFQGFLFNIVIFVGFLFLGLNYFYPEYQDIEEKKTKLTKIQRDYNILKSRGLNYEKFSQLHGTLGKRSGLDKNVYLKNVIKEFTKEDYKKDFINNSGGKYEDFIRIKEIEVKKKKEELDNSGVSNSIKNILPAYSEDSSIKQDSLTDFKFINYIEKLLNNFRLSYSNTIGIGDLHIEDSVESTSLKTKVNQLEGRIYNFKLELNLKGRKKNIIDFIHYLENVGNIKVLKTGEIEIKNADVDGYYINNEGVKVKNDFSNLPRYFLGKKDIYNNLVVDIESIKMKDYLDSSKLPTHYSKGETFISFIKNDSSQVNEKYEVSLVLRFYVKGLPVYKIKNYIKDVVIRHQKLLGFTSGGIKFGEKNKAKLKYFQRSGLKKLKEFNYYLQGITKDVKNLKNPKELQTHMGDMYKKAQKYNEIFDLIEKGLDVYLKRVSNDLYKKYIKTK